MKLTIIALITMLLLSSSYAGTRRDYLVKQRYETKQTINFMKNLLVDRETRAPRNLSKQFVDVLRREDHHELLKNIEFYEKQYSELSDYLSKH